MTINLSLILQKTRILKQFPLSVFVVIDALVVLDDLGGYAVASLQNLLGWADLLSHEAPHARGKTAIFW